MSEIKGSLTIANNDYAANIVDALSSLIQEKLLNEQANSFIENPYLRNDLLYKTKIFAKMDVCEIINLDNIDNYSRILSFNKFVKHNGKFFYLYRENGTDKLVFINKRYNGTGTASGIALNIDNISNEDSEKLIELHLENEKNPPETSFTFHRIEAVLGIGYVVGLFGVFISYRLIFIGVFLVVIGLSIKKKGPEEAKSIDKVQSIVKVDTKKDVEVTEKVIKEEKIEPIFLEDKEEDRIKPRVVNRKKKRERY